MTSPSPRARFAPAPTGWLHVGSARAALFNWLFARHTGGEFVLRIEDTDPERSREELVDAVFRTLTWLGIDWDGEPVRQSQRADLYREAADRLVASDRVYACDCTREQIDERTKGSSTPGYDGHCRDRGLEPGPGRVLRFRVPRDGATSFDDVIRGHVSFEHANLEDFVVMRSDGTATFFLPNAVDDLDMGITHVIRGEDLINVTPRVLLLREALGHDEHPVFAHLPLLVNEQRKKLSKRREDSAVEEYRERGYVPEAVANYLALLGWGPSDGVEVRPMEEIIELFRLEDVNKAPAFFDQKKLDHVNGEYLRQLSPEAFADAARPWIERGPWRPEDFDPKAFERLAPELQTRTVTLAQVPEMVDFLFLPQPPVDEASWQKAMVKGRDLAVSVLDVVIPAYESCAWDAATLHETLRGIAESVGSGLAKVQAPVRVAVTGRTVGPPLFESLEVLGRERTLERLRAARDRL